jgi:thiol-disulfide isomerase/thioredoxin
MKKSPFLLTLLIPSLLFAQKKFKIELDAPSYINDSIIFSPPLVRVGFEELYNFKLNTNESIIVFGKRFKLKYSVFQVRVQEKNILEGQFEYPQPVSFQYYDLKANHGYRTSTFFLDSGYYKINFPRMVDFYEIKLNSPVNNEYSIFKKIFSDLYIKLDNKLGFDSLTDLTKKEKRIGSYIKKNPNSYVAFWEIVNDYTLNNFNSIYIDNLQLFSDEIKKTDLYRKFESKMNAENSTMIGREFPTINFNKKSALTKEVFRKYKLTFIDYWSTACAPCLKAMPEIVAMYNNYKEKGVNFITITDEGEPKRIELAKKILNKNNAKWSNYFDINKDFKNKLNATGYPLHFLIDQNGKIIARGLGDLDEIKKNIDDNLKSIVR